MHSDKTLHIVSFAPYGGSEQHFKTVLDRSADMEERMYPKPDGDSWIPLDKLTLGDDRTGLTVDMRSYASKAHRFPLPENMTATVPESIIRKEDILPFLHSLKEKGIRWPFFADNSESILMWPNKYLRFFPIGDGQYTVNNRNCLPVDWKSILHYYDNR